MEVPGAILTHDSIIKEIETGNIKISNPFVLDNVGPASVDLTLGYDFRIFIEPQSGKFDSFPGPIEITDDTAYQDPSITQLIHLKEGETFTLPPHSICHGITQEKITLTSNICGFLEGRSRFARLGLLVHFTAPFMNPGIDNHQVLEICNLSSRPMILHPGTKICQFIFIRSEGQSTYHGQYKNQTL